MQLLTCDHELGYGCHRSQVSKGLLQGQTEQYESYAAILWPMLLNFFQRNYVAIGITSVKIIREICRLVRKFCQKSFIIFATGPNVIKHSSFIIYKVVFTLTRLSMIMPVILQRDIAFLTCLGHLGWHDTDRIRKYYQGTYHCAVGLLFDWFGLVCFANKNKICQ